MGKEALIGGIFLGLTAISFFMGGTGYRYMVVQDMGIVAGAMLGLLAWIYNKYQLRLPPYFWLYMGLAALVGWDVMTRANPFTSPQFFSMVVSGGLFWVAFYTVGRSLVIQRYYLSILLGLGWCFFGLLVLNMGGVLDKYQLYFGMIQPLTAEHHHLGVYWALLLIPVLSQLFEKRVYSWQLMVPAGLGIYLMIMSQARSAFLGLIVGMIAYYYQELKSAKSLERTAMKLAVVAAGLAIVGISVYKPIRSFYFYTPAVLNLLRQPFGSGMGQFEKVSSYYAYLYESGDFVTSSAHNLLLEMTTGLGWVGIIFGVWMVLSVRVALRAKPKGRDPFLAMYLALAAIFMVDPAYQIPTMYWVWMSTLGISQSREMGLRER